MTSNYPSVSHLSSAVSGQKTVFAILTDLTPEDGLSAAAASTILYLLANKSTNSANTAQQQQQDEERDVIVFPTRHELAGIDRIIEGSTTVTIAEALGRALTHSLKAANKQDLERIRIADPGRDGLLAHAHLIREHQERQLAQQSSSPLNQVPNAGVSPFLFVNDAFDKHPTALALAKMHGSDNVATGFAFSALHSDIWPLKSKTVLLLTDAACHIDRQLLVCTVNSLNRAGARSIHVACTSPERNAANQVASILRVPLEQQLPNGRFSPMWKRVLSVSNAPSSRHKHDDTTTTSAAPPATVGKPEIRLCAKACHAFVNDMKCSAHDFAEAAVDTLRHQALGALREAAMVVGGRQLATQQQQHHQQKRHGETTTTTTTSAAGAAATSNASTAAVRSVNNVWPIKNKRFLILCNKCVFFDSNGRKPSAVQSLTYSTVAHIVNGGGVAILVNAECVAPQEGSEEETDDEVQQRVKAHLERVAPRAACVNFFDPNNSSSSTAAIKTRSAAPRSIFFCHRFSEEAGKSSAVVDCLVASCDVLVRDLVSSCFNPVSSSSSLSLLPLVLHPIAETVLSPEKSGIQHLSIGHAEGSLQVDFTVADYDDDDAQQQPTRRVRQLQHHRTISHDVLRMLDGDEDFLLPHQQQSSRSPTGQQLSPQSRRQLRKEQFEVQEMRKPVDGGEGSLMSNVFASLATCVLLHPVQLFIYPVPTTTSPIIPSVLRPAESARVRSSSYLALRCVHAFSRDVAFHMLSKKLELRALFTNCSPAVYGAFQRFGLMPGWLAACLSGVVTDPIRATAAGCTPLEALGTLRDPTCVATTAAMNLAPQISFRMTNAVMRRVQRYVTPYKIQLRFIVAAICRSAVCVVLFKLVQMRRYPGQVMNFRDSKSILLAYMLREVVAWLIESMVQRFFR